MRYFSRGWADGDLSDEECEQARNAYWKRVNEITPRLPPAMVRLANELRLHDGLVEQVVWNPRTKQLRLSLVCEDAHEGTVQAVLIYGGAMLGASRIESLKRAALCRETELLYDEVDIDDDAILSHRLLFSPREEVTIDFKELHLVVSSRTDRRVALRPACIVEAAGEDE